MRKRLLVPLSAAIGLLAGVQLNNIATLVAAPSDATTLQATAERWQQRRFRDVSRKTEVRCPAQAMKVLVLGQSNAANTVGERIPASGDVFEWWRGKCYRASSPMLGGDGTGGSIWPLVGEMLGRPVIFAVASIGATTSGEWRAQAGPNLFLDQIEAPPDLTHVVWMQGEADALSEVGESDYLANMGVVMAFLRSKHPNASILVSQTTRCGPAHSAAVRAAQLKLLDAERHVFAGPDTDQAFGDRYRYDGCHLSGLGARQAAAGWAKSIAAAPSSAR